MADAFLSSILIGCSRNADAPIVPKVDERHGVVEAPSANEIARQERAKRDAYDTFAGLLGDDLAQLPSRAADDNEGAICV